MAILIIGSIGNVLGLSGKPSPSPAAVAASQSPLPSESGPALAAPSVLPSGATKLSADQVARVKSILTANLKHYETAYAAGKLALGTKPYSDAFAGLAAMNDPTSSAVKFSTWRTSTGIEQDVSFLNAFTQADAYYNANNEPDAIGTWRNDMSDATSALDEWVQVAVSWQISEVSSADLASAEAAVTKGFALAQKDINATIAASQ